MSETITSFKTNGSNHLKTINKWTFDCICGLSTCETKK